MNILHLTAVGGGVEVYINLISKNINQSEFQTIVTSPNDYFKNIKEPHLKYNIKITRNINPFTDLRAIYSFIKIINKTKPDLLHLHSAKAGIIGRVAGYITRVPMAYTPHAFSYLSSSNKSKRFLFLLLEKLFKYTGNYIIATSYSEAHRAIKDVGYKKHKVKVFENSISPINEDALSKKSLNFELPSNYICSIGRPSYQKNIQAMVKVFKKIKIHQPDLHFILLGVGLYSPDYEEVKNMIKDYNLESSFIMLPWMKREQTFNIVKNAKIYISTSRYEGLPYAVIEALALGKPCILSNCDGNRDLVIENKNGYLINFENLADDMAATCIKLINNVEELTAMGKNSTLIFNEKFNIENNIQNLEILYKNLKLSSQLKD